MTPDQQRDAMRAVEEARLTELLVDAAIRWRRERGFYLTEVDGEIVERPLPMSTARTSPE